MGRIPPPETEPSEPTRHPGRPAGPETVSPPLRSSLHSGSTRDADDRPSASADGPRPNHSDIETETTWLQSANPGAAAHTFTTKTASPARRRRTRRPACRGDPSANRAATATNSWLLRRCAATTAPRALPRGPHRESRRTEVRGSTGSGHPVPPRCDHRRGACPGQSCNGASATSWQG